MRNTANEEGAPNDRDEKHDHERTAYPARRSEPFQVLNHVGHSTGSQRQVASGTHRRWQRPLSQERCRVLHSGLHDGASVTLPSEQVTGSTITTHNDDGIREVAKRKTKCQSCGEYILKGQERFATTDFEREWINGTFQTIRKTRYTHVSH
jgi:hypothetical protein